MKARKMGTWFTAIAGVAVAAALAAAGPAVAAEAAFLPMDISLTAGVATLRPLEGGGYRGTLPVTISYTGPDDVFPDLRIAAPQGFYLSGSPDYDACWSEQVRYTYVCPLNGEFTSGETTVVEVNFWSPAKPTTKTRRSLTGSVTVAGRSWEHDVVESTPADNTARFGGVLVGTGQGFDRRPYRPATGYDLTATAAESAAVFTPDSGDGAGYVAKLTVTIKVGTDAYQNGTVLSMLNEWPGLSSFSALEYQTNWYTCEWTEIGRTCETSNHLAAGTTFTVPVVITTEQLPPAGTHIRLRADTWVVGPAGVGGEYAIDVTPADNMITVPVA